MTEKKHPVNNQISVSENFEDFELFLQDLDEEDKNHQQSTESLTLVYSGKRAAEIVFQSPRVEKIISPGYFKVISLELLEFTRSEKKVSTDCARYHFLCVLPGDRIAYTKNGGREELSSSTENSIPLIEGEHIKITADGEYIAEQYGYACLVNDTLQVLSPVLISEEKLTLEWLFSGSPGNEIKKEMVEFWSQKAGITIPEGHIADYLFAANDNRLEPDCYTLASGGLPVHGQDGKIEWAVDINASIGKELPDGTINFKERNLIINVAEGQLVARLLPATKGLPGKNLHGKVIESKNGKPAQLVAGQNIRQVENGSATLFYATSEGALHHAGREVYVNKVLILPQGVNYQTGNIDFLGDVIIQGSISSGFSVKAGGDVVMSDTVEDGVIIDAAGDITATRGVSGKRVKINAGKNLYTPYVNEASLSAGDNIIMTSYAFHAKLRAGGMIQVKFCSDERSGSIMGGEAWAKQRIDTYIVGSEAWPHTELIVGILPEQTAVLDKLQKDIEGKKKHIHQILSYFGIATVDLKKIKGLIEQADGITRKSMALRAKYLAKAGKIMQDLLAQHSKLKAEIGPAATHATIVVREKAYPNVTIRIGNKKKEIKREMGSATFELEHDELTIA